MKKILTGVAMVVTMAIISSGCSLAVAAWSANRTSEAMENAAKRQAEATETLAYSQYKSSAERTNMDREKSGMKPIPVMSLEEWKVANR